MGRPSCAEKGLVPGPSSTSASRPTLSQSASSDRGRLRPADVHRCTATTRPACAPQCGPASTYP
eukprot:111959-Alexandrium_andersonii.AAC.1